MVRVRKQLMPSGKTLLLEAGLLIGRADCPGLALQAQKPLLAKLKPSHGELPSPAPSRSSSLHWQTLAADGSRDKNPLTVWARPPSSMSVDRGLTQFPAWQRWTSGGRGSDWEENRARREVAAGWLDTELGKGETTLLLSLDR